ncbi:hypothetical protein SVAN01_06468 [Stagonosporopsis vannaccii]|nr:hypothetical protein SVAN01_06468 [Stagonosporopsis vannaccii]
MARVPRTLHQLRPTPAFASLSPLTFKVKSPPLRDRPLSPTISANPRRCFEESLILCHTVACHRATRLGYRFKPFAADWATPNLPRLHHMAKQKLYVTVKSRVVDVVTREFCRDLHVMDSGGCEFRARWRLDDISSPSIGLNAGRFSPRYVATTIRLRLGSEIQVVVERVHG